jgi:transmembrane sensor
LFKVAHNRDWPFVVTAGPKTITAVGTAFVVQKHADQVIVTVTDGSVEVASQPDAHNVIQGTSHTPTHSPSSRVARGQKISYVAGGSIGEVEIADPEAAAAWSQGQLEFDHEPLWAVVHDLNRYSHRRITVDHSCAVDQDCGGQIVTGLVLQNQIDGWIRRLPAVYSVEIIERGAEVCLRARRPEPNAGPASCGETN